MPKSSSVTWCPPFLLQVRVLTQLRLKPVRLPPNSTRNRTENSILDLDNLLRFDYTITFDPDPTHIPTFGTVTFQSNPRLVPSLNKSANNRLIFNLTSVGHITLASLRLIMTSI
jgi:hypothetical protein